MIDKICPRMPNMVRELRSKEKKPKGISNEGTPTAISLFEFTVLCSRDPCFNLAMQIFCHYSVGDYIEYFDTQIPSWFETEDKDCDQRTEIEGL